MDGRKSCRFLNYIQAEINTISFAVCVSTSGFFIGYNFMLVIAGS